ncbi:restriction endonuclease subunit S [Nocardia sp. bgisy134]|uniref:restriction endonuclease subunit S n=1 Tax=Nocardia sp. bgisy134 TaxID=3413789 RepID=UPI003D708313
MPDRSVRLSELAQKNWIEVGAGRPRSAVLDGYSLPILRVADVLDGTIAATLRGAEDIPEERLSNPKISRPGDVVLTVKGTVGRVAIMPAEGVHFAYSPQLCYFRPSNDGPLIARYLYYWFKSTEFWKQANALKGQTDMADYISLSDILSLKISLPNISEQRAIAEVLGALDDKIVVNNRTSGIASDLAASLFQSTIGEPDATTQSSIRALATEGLLTYGDGYRTKRPEHGQPGMQIIRAGDVRDGRLVLSGDDFVSNDYSDKVRAKICHPGDIVLTTKGTVGRVATVQDNIRPSVYSPQLCYFRVAKDHSWLQPWLAEWFRSADRVRQTDIAMHKSDMAPYVNLQDVGSLQVPMPAEGPHEPVIERLSSLQSLGHVIARENEVLATTRDELLPLLMSGKLRVKDAEKKVEAIA